MLIYVAEQRDICMHMNRYRERKKSVNFVLVVNFCKFFFFSFSLCLYVMDDWVSRRFHAKNSHIQKEFFFPSKILHFFTRNFVGLVRSLSLHHPHTPSENEVHESLKSRVQQKKTKKRPDLG